MKKAVRIGSYWTAGVVGALLLTFWVSRSVTPVTTEDLAQERATAIARAETDAKIAAIRRRANRGDPAHTDRCPGHAPVAPTLLTTEKLVLNPPDERGQTCDLFFALTKGDIEFDGPDGTFSPVTDGKGRTTTKRLVSVKALSDTAEIFYILCPRGMGPENGGWICKRESPQSDIRQAGLTFGIGLNTGVYYSK